MRKNLTFESMLDELLNTEYDALSMAKTRKLTDQIRHAIETCGESRYAIGKATGIAQATFSRFMHGKGGLSPDVLDRLGEYLGLRIVMDSPKRKEK